MNTYQTNKLACYAAVEAVLKANPEIATVPGLPAKVEMLSARIGEIHHLAREQTEPMGITIAKRNTLFAAMTAMTLEVAGVVMNVARDRSLPEVAQAVNITASAFRLARRPQQIWLAQRVHETARTVLEPLATYGVTAETLATLERRIRTASEAIHMPRTTVTSKKSATQQLTAVFRAVDALLRDEIDRLVYRLRADHPRLHADYRAARAVVDVGRRRPAPPAEAPPAVPTTEGSVERPAA